MSFIGVNIGALTVRVAALRGDARTATVLAHQGRPLEILAQVLARPEFADAEYFGVSGQLGHISEVAAVQRALREVEGPFDAVASLGGDTGPCITINTSLSDPGSASAARVLLMSMNYDSLCGLNDYAPPLFQTFSRDKQTQVQCGSRSTPLTRFATIAPLDWGVAPHHEAHTLLLR